ncbi:MAG: hypothetical protein R6V25_15075 [Desulfatiglandales bacterium]
MKEDSGVYGLKEIDFDPDSDFDPEETKQDAHSSRQCSLALGCGQGPALVFLRVLRVLRGEKNANVRKKPHFHVTAAIIRRNGRLLITRRPVTLDTLVRKARRVRRYAITETSPPTGP